jgi:D-alanine-D-alanine ligase
MKKRVAIVCGGRSSEHEISCISAGGVLAAIDRTLYEPVLIGITKSGSWVLIPDSHSMEIQGKALPTVPEDAQPVVVDVAGFSVAGKPLDIDVVFPLLHGPYGEDGTIQGLLEMANIAYVGSGVLASAVAMDKSFAKPIFSSHGIATAPGIVVKKSDWDTKKASITKDVEALGLPVFVKPARGGSSRGTTKVKSIDALPAAITEAHSFDPKAMIEKAIEGAEIECAVLEIDGVAQASVVGKIHIDSKFEFYDFEAKYLDGATSIELPAPIDERTTSRIQESAVKAFTALGCAGLARIDFFVTPRNEVIINELNTMPGFTATSVFPKMWAASGVSYPDVITHLLKNAERRTNGVLGN